MNRKLYLKLIPLLPMTVAAILRGYIDKQNKQAIYIRITKGSKRTYKRTQIKLLPDQWNGQVKSSHPQYKLFNQVIKKLILEAETELLNPSLKFPAENFYKYCIECEKQWQHSKASETMRQHASEINKLKAFSLSLNLSSVTTDWLNKYKAHLFSIGNKNNTVHKSLKFVRLIVRKAFKERLIEQNPFDLFEMPRYRNPQIKYLTKEQVLSIEEISHNKELSEEIRFVATWFCVGCYTGLRFGDMQKFNHKKHVINNRIVLYTQKTGTPVSMPVSLKLKALFEQVNLKGVNISNVHFNRVLKQIGGIAEAGNLNAHMSRHTCAVMWANAGISQEVVAKLLGHTDLKSTAIYFKITSIRIDEELKKLSL